MKFKQIFFLFIAAFLFPVQPTSAMENKLTQKLANKCLHFIHKHPEIIAKYIVMLSVYTIYKISKYLPDKYKQYVLLYIKAVIINLHPKLNNSNFVSIPVTSVLSSIWEYLSYLYLKKSIDKDSFINAWISLNICLANPNSYILNNGFIINESPLLQALRLNKTKIAKLIWMHHLCIKNTKWEGKSTFAWAVEKKIKEIIDHFTKTIKFIENNLEQNIDKHCVICLEDNASHITECGHKFCYDCITQWMVNNTICPTCRAPIE